MNRLRPRRIEENKLKDVRKPFRLRKDIDNNMHIRNLFQLEKENETIKERIIGHPKRCQHLWGKGVSQKQNPVDREEGDQPNVEVWIEKKIIFIFFMIIWKYFLSK